MVFDVSYFGGQQFMHNSSSSTLILSLNRNRHRNEWPYLTTFLHLKDLQVTMMNSSNSDIAGEKSQ
jgi:hypothetical protein